MIRRVARAGLAVLLAISVTASIAGLLGGFSAIGDAFNQIAPLWSLGGGIAAVLLARSLWVAGHGTKLFWSVAVAILLGYSASWIARDRHKSISPIEDQNIRIVTFNVWNRNETIAKAVAWLSTRDADVIILQEAMGRAAHIADALSSAYPYRVSCYGEHPCSTLILSRIAPSQSKGLARGDAENRRALSGALMRFDASTQPFSIAAVHLSHSWPLGQQTLDVRRLLASLADVPKNSLILAGDFNAAPWTMTMNRIERGLALEREPGLWPSWGWRLPRGHRTAVLPIDHVLAGAGWKIVSVTQSPDLGSDHRALEVMLTRSSR